MRDLARERKAGEVDELLVLDHERLDLRLKRLRDPYGRIDRDIGDMASGAEMQHYASAVLTNFGDMRDHEPGFPGAPLK
jgi:hypothetical protein